MTSVPKQMTCVESCREENIPECVALLWEKLKGGQYAPLKFMRQVIFSEYVVDFASVEQKVIVECAMDRELFSPKDAKRDAWFRKEGYTVLKFWDTEIYIDMQGVLDTIGAACRQPVSAPAD
jgi:very-short-patch-repair endonuclease